MFSGHCSTPWDRPSVAIWAHPATSGQQIGLAAQTEMLKIECRVSRIAIASGAAEIRPLIVHLSSLGGPHRHARIHDEALVSGVRRRRPLTGHLLLTVTPPAPRL